MEEKSREIGEAAHRYAYTRARNWILVAILVGIALGAYAVTQHAGSLLMQQAAARPQLDVDRLADQAKRNALVAVTLQYLGTGLAVWLGWFVLERWRFGDPSVVTSPSRQDEAPSREPVRTLCSRALHLGGWAVFLTLSCYGYRLLFRASPRFQPLIMLGMFTLFMLVTSILCWRRHGMRILGDSTGETIGVIAAYVYALAIAGGLPRPFGAISEDTAETFGVIAPLALLLICWVVGDAVYSRRQFRRLQRLVNEGSDGTG